MRAWSEAMRSALYGPDGFYLRHRPADHFRTSVTASPQLAAALARMVVEVDGALGRPERLTVVDVGAGDGRLLTGLLAALPDHTSQRVDAVAVELRPRPAELTDQIAWRSEAPSDVTGVLIAHELLDNVPCDVVQRTDGSLHVVMVDDDGSEHPGHEVGAEQRTWLDEWWPLPDDSGRAECGTERDEVWADLVARLREGVALAVDYGHVRADRAAGAFAAGTLTGYRDGHQVWPVPDGTCDITAHVAMDACAAAGRRAGAVDTVVVTQREALASLGVTGALPDVALAHSQPADYVRQLSAASEAAELLDPAGLGSFLWLLQSKGVPLPSIGNGALSG